MNRWTQVLVALVALVAFVGLLLVAGGVVADRPGAERPASPADRSAPTGPPSSAPTPRSTPPLSQPTATGTTVTPCPDGRPVGTVSVLTFNIHGALSHTGYDLERVAREIEAWDADVVLLQEVDRHRARTAFDDQPAALAARLGLDAAYGRNVVRRPAVAGQPRQEYGTAILSRLPIRDRRNIALPNRPGLEQRGLLRATVRVGERWVNVYNTHLQHTRGTIRIVQMRAIRRIVARDPRPHLVGGDLNATPDSVAMGVAGTFVRDPWPAVGVGAGLTVPAHVPQRRIDYLLHDDSWVPTGAETLVSTVSDHRAVRVVFALLPPRGC